LCQQTCADLNKYHNAEVALDLLKCNYAQEMLHRTRS